MIKLTLIAALSLFGQFSFANSSMYEPIECVVVGNTNSKIYHVAGGRSYAKMLRKNKGKDNRKCFSSEKEAKDADYRKSKI